MQARSSRILSLAFGLGLGLGCQAPPDISGEIETYTELIDRVNAELCVCYQLLGFDSADACSDELGIVTFEEEDCVARVLEGHEEIAQEHLSCANSAMERYLQCIENNASCEDSVANQCEQTQTSEFAACPTLPADVLAEFSACTQ